MPSSYTWEQGHARLHTHMTLCAHACAWFSAVLLPRFPPTGARGVHGKCPQCVTPDHTQGHPQPRPPSPVASPAETWGASPEAAQNSSVRTALRPASSGPLAWTPRDGPSVQTARGQPANRKRATVPVQLEAAGSVCSVRAGRGLRRAEKTLPSPFHSVLSSAPLQRSRSKQNAGRRAGWLLQRPPPPPCTLWLACLTSGSGLLRNSGGGTVSTS